MRRLIPWLLAGVLASSMAVVVQAAMPTVTPDAAKLSEVLKALKDDQRDVADRVKAQEAALLEAQRKSIDWWFGALAILNNEQSNSD
jgi:hypothetical protein